MRFILFVVVLTMLQGCSHFEKEAPMSTGIASDISQLLSSNNFGLPPKKRYSENMEDARYTQSQVAVKSYEILADNNYKPGDGTLHSTDPLNNSAKKVRINFVDVDVKEFIKVVFEEILHQNYILSPQIKGKITVKTSHPISHSEILEIAQQVLQSKDIEISESNGLYKFSLSSNGRGVANTSNYKFRIFPLKYTQPQAIKQALKNLKIGRVIIFDESIGHNLVASGTKKELDHLQSLIQVFDVDQLKNKSFGLYALKNAKAGDVSKEIINIFDKSSSTQSQISVTPISRMNAILVVANRANYLKEARKWVLRLDQKLESAMRQLFVYQVQNRRAEELSIVLNGIFKNVKVSDNQASASNTINTPGLNNKVISSDDTGPGVDNFAVKNDNKKGKGAVRITADKSTNSIIIYANSEEHKAILSALKRLDTVPVQVLIEATIAEVSLNDNLKHGVKWFFETGRSKLLLTDSDLASLGATLPGFNYFLNAPNVRVVVNALEKVTDVEIVSSPSLTVLDNQKARLQVGDQVPIATRASTSTVNADAPIINDIELKDTGIILEVTPRVSSSNLVSLDIFQEVSDVVNTSSSNIDSPTIQQRKVNSSIAVKSGQAIILGGLISKKNTHTEGGIPFLKDLPNVGKLFKQVNNEESRTELIIIIRPTVIRNQYDANLVTQELADKILGLDNSFK